jgi:hypothetical protein
MRNIKYRYITDDDIMCSHCGGHTDIGLECGDCCHDMWTEVYPEDFIGKYTNIAPADDNDAHITMKYSFTNGEVREYTTNHRIVCHEGAAYKLSSEDGMTTFYGILYLGVDMGINNYTCVLHREDGPALISVKSVFFFIDGKQRTIEEMPCDDQVKTILKLKYGDADTRMEYYPVYRE